MGVKEPPTMSNPTPAILRSRYRDLLGDTLETMARLEAAERRVGVVKGRRKVVAKATVKVLRTTLRTIVERRRDLLAALCTR